MSRCAGFLDEVVEIRCGSIRTCQYFLCCGETSSVWLGKSLTGVKTLTEYPYCTRKYSISICTKNKYSISTLFKSTQLLLSSQRFPAHYKHPCRSPHHHLHFSHANLMFVDQVPPLYFELVMLLFRGLRYSCGVSLGCRLIRKAIILKDLPRSLRNTPSTCMFLHRPG